MSIGLKRGTVELAEWNAEFAVSAKQIILMLKNILKDDAVDIQHIGSTSIRGIKTKPIVDITVGVRDFGDIEKHNTELETAGIHYRKMDLPDQHLYVVGEGEYRTHHIHAVLYNSVRWNHYINFRDYLNQRPEIAFQYSRLKEELAKEFANDRGAYTQAKQEMIDDILKKAAIWRDLDQDLALEEFDDEPIGMIDPVKLLANKPRVPKIFISCFAYSSFDRLRSFIGNSEEIGKSKCANYWTPYYRAVYQGIEIGLICAEVGAPSCVGLFDELFAMGAETIILYGNCGVLDGSIEDLGIILPTSAVRDEGTSFHYAPPSREIDVNVDYGPLFEEMLLEMGIRYRKGKTWTTDGIYRETLQKVQQRKKEGCICVDMEASAMAALAQLRGKKVLQFFYAGDNLDTPEWDERSLLQHTKLEEKDKIGLLALEAARRIHEIEV